MQRKESLPRSREDIIAFINGDSIYLYILYSRFPVDKNSSRHSWQMKRSFPRLRATSIDLSGNPAWIVVIRLEKRGGNSSKKGRSRYLLDAITKNSCKERFLEDIVKNVKSLIDKLFFKKINSSYAWKNSTYPFMRFHKYHVQSVETSSSTQSWYAHFRSFVIPPPVENYYRRIRKIYKYNRKTRSWSDNKIKINRNAPHPDTRSPGNELIPPPRWNARV